MQLYEDTADAGYQIKFYDSDNIIINDKSYKNSLIIMPEKLIEWPVNNAEDLTIDNISIIADFAPELVLLGTGNELKQIPPYILQPLTKLQIGVEIMNTAAACRTYTVLISESRKVAAAIII